MGFAGSDAFASLSFPFSLRRGPPPKFGGANDKLDRLFYDSIARRRHLTSEVVFATVEKQRCLIINRTQAQKMNDLQLFVMPQIGLIREEEPRLTEETVRRDLSTRLCSRHFRNELLLFNEHFDTFRELAQETWPGLRISDLSHRYGENISLLVTDNDYAAEIGMMGSGLQMWLQLIWFVSRCPETATVVLDEPDVYMHPDLQRKILKIVQQRFSQTIIATHSVEIISGVEPRQIVTVDKRSRKMQYANSYKAVQEVLSNLGSDLNLSLIRLGNAKKCVFVEGNDITLLRKIQDILYPESQWSVDILPTVALGGWSRFNEALGTARLFYEETHGEIETLCILDKDYHTEDEVNRLYELSAENHLQLHVWQRKEIENYILSPRALARVAGVDPDSLEMENFLSELYIKLDELAEQTKGSIVDQFYQLYRGKNPSYYLSQAEQIFSAGWSTLEGRLSLACGKDVIKLVNGWIRSKYLKRSSRSKIIAALSREDIPEEMKEVIDRLLQ